MCVYFCGESNWNFVVFVILLWEILLDIEKYKVFSQITYKYRIKRFFP